MQFKKLLNDLSVLLKNNGYKKAEYLRKKNFFASMGENCFWQPWHLPSDPKLIRLSNNVVVTSEVLFVTHDVIHHMANHSDNDNKYSYYVDPIQVGNNVFIGTRSVILPGTKIEDNVIIGAGSIVKGRLEEGGVYAGNPAKRVGEVETFLQKRKNDSIEFINREDHFQKAWEKFDKRNN